METIGILTAISQETEALLPYIGKWERIPIGSFYIYRFQLWERDCLLIESGMGIKRAANAAKALLAAANPQFVVSFGVAGAVENDLQIGDVVLARTTCILEQGNPSQFHCLAFFSDSARKASAEALELHGGRLCFGTAITTRGSQIILPQAEIIEHPILEMETAGIAQVLKEKRIPLLSVRAISDCPQEPIPFNLSTAIDEDGNLNLGKMILMIIGRPIILFQSRRLLRNAKKAADNAAMVVIAALRQPVVLAPENRANL
jgi:adenosylhomocysteine nucleosidase